MGGCARAHRALLSEGARTAQTSTFDRIVGELEDVLVDPAFQERLNSFCKEHCGAFARLRPPHGRRAVARDCLR